MTEISNKKILNAKSTSYNDINFKSKLEVACYKKLVASGLTFAYEPETITIWIGNKIVNTTVYLPDKYKMLIKLNFSSYIDKFERENINIIAFGINIPIKQKIEIIYNKLLEYAKADDSIASSQGTEGAAGSQEGRATQTEE